FDRRRGKATDGRAELLVVFERREGAARVGGFGDAVVLGWCTGKEGEERKMVMRGGEGRREEEMSFAGGSVGKEERRMRQRLFSGDGDFVSGRWGRKKGKAAACGGGGDAVKERGGKGSEEGERAAGMRWNTGNNFPAGCRRWTERKRGDGAATRVR
ncbi:hypothetical protein HAX54_030467, partial [Datura stramonium]|nr:hypothetical protein [Datura stramonium]